MLTSLVEFLIGITQKIVETTEKATSVKVPALIPVLHEMFALTFICTVIFSFISIDLGDTLFGTFLILLKYSKTKSDIRQERRDASLVLTSHVYQKYIEKALFNRVNVPERKKRAAATMFLMLMIAMYAIIGLSSFGDIFYILMPVSYMAYKYAQCAIPKRQIVLDAEA